MGETILPERSIRNMHYTRLELYDPLKKNRFLRTNGARTRGGGRKLEKLVKGERIERPVSIDLFRSRAFAAEPYFPPPNTFHPRSKTFVRFSRGERRDRKKRGKGASSRKISRRKTRGSIHISLSELGESRDFKNRPLSQRKHFFFFFFYF